MQPHGEGTPEDRRRQEPPSRWGLSPDFLAKAENIFQERLIAEEVEEAGLTEAERRAKRLQDARRTYEGIPGWVVPADGGWPYREGLEAQREKVQDRIMRDLELYAEHQAERRDTTPARVLPIPLRERIADAHPTSIASLARVPGMGPQRLGAHALSIVAIVRGTW